MGFKIIKENHENTKKIDLTAEIAELRREKRGNYEPALPETDKNTRRSLKAGKQGCLKAQSFLPPAAAGLITLNLFSALSAASAVNKSVFICLPCEVLT